MSGLTRAEIIRLFNLLNAELEKQAKEGEVYLVGGAVMCLAFEARDSTKDIDAVFRPTRVIREAAGRIAAEHNVATGWLNDAVKGYLSTDGDFDPFIDMCHLRVFIAQPQYLLAMKCAAMRLGEEFHDLEDVRYLLRYLNISNSEEAMAIVSKYFDERQLQPKTRLALQELLD